ncbi:MAG: hypothetical protein ACQEW9_17915 [Bacteroidota bacterium]
MRDMQLTYKPLNFYIVPVTRNYIKLENIFWISILVFSFSYLLSSSYYSLAAVLQGIQILSISAFIFSLLSLIEVREVNRYFLFLITMLGGWEILMLLRANYALMDYEDTKSFFFDANYGVFCLVIPFVSLIKVSLLHVKKLFDSFFICSILYLAFCVLFYGIIFKGDITNFISREIVESSIKFFAFPCTFILLTFPLQNKRSKIGSVLVFVVFMAIAIINARRGIILMGGIVFSLALMMYLMNSSKKIAWILFGIYLSFFIYEILLIDDSIGDVQILSNLFERGLENTRSYVENCFYSSMSTTDWLIGKGFNAGYLCAGIDESVFKDGIRRVIETDYLQLILTGGIVNLGLILLLMLSAVTLGLFYSKNLLCKAAAVWILVWLIFLYPSNGFTFSIFHVSVWLMVSVCFNGSLRSMNNGFLVGYFREDLNFKKREKT